LHFVIIPFVSDTKLILTFSYLPGQLGSHHSS